MTLTVEDGSIVSGADSYAALATVTAYHTARGNSAWDGEDADAEPAILRAMDYLEGLPWVGDPYYGYQTLQWPRYGVFFRGVQWAVDEIPPQVVKALCEAALIEFEEPGALAPALERGGMIESEKVDVLSTTYAKGAPVGTAYRKVTQHLRGLLHPSNMGRITR